MYCPRCSQQQISDEARFCSRCGFPLGAVAELLASGGVPARRGVETEKAQLSPRQRGVRAGAKIMFWSLVLVPIAGALSIPADSPGPLVIPLAVFFIGLVKMLYARLFGESAQLMKQGERAVLIEAAAQNAALPPSRSIPVTNFNAPGTNTAEMGRPSSVTENTTQLLDDERRPSMH